MARLKLRWTPLAIEDLENTYDFIAADRPLAAAATLGKIEAAIQQLRSFPRMGRVGRIRGTREIAVAGTPFVIAYRRRDKYLELLAIMHAARKWPDHLE